MRKLKINPDKVKELVKKGKTDKEISVELNCSEIGVWGCRNRNNIVRPSFAVSKEVQIGKIEMEILKGCLLGDGNLYIEKKAKNPRFSCEHSMSQRDYCKWKYKELSSINPFYKELVRKTEDKRNGNIYQSAKVRTNANPCYHEIYPHLYKNGVKVITEEFLNGFSALSLAVMYMDDGFNSIEGGIFISTNSFTDKDLDVFYGYCFKKFGLKFKKVSRNQSYLPIKFYEKFETLVKPYIHPTMMYKLK